MHGQVEVRETGGKLILRGHASVSERWYPVGSMFEEKVRRGTWKRSLGENPDTVLLQDHTGLAFARTKTPTGKPSLILTEDDVGLFCEAFLDASAPRVQDLRSTAENCGLQMSVGFRCTRDLWTDRESKRELIAASIHRGDVTACNFGASESTSATISERGEAGAAERRAYAESLKGCAERRMCPVEFEAVSVSQRADRDQAETARRARIDLERDRLVLERDRRSAGRSYLTIAKAKAARARMGTPSDVAKAEVDVAKARRRR